MSNWIDVATLESFPPGACRVVPIEGMPIAVFNVNGRFYAVDNVCTHEFAELSEGQLEGEEIVCPMHGARFSVMTGEVTAPPAYEDLRTFPVQVVDGMVQVDAGKD